MPKKTPEKEKKAGKGAMARKPEPSRKPASPKIESQAHKPSRRERQERPGGRRGMTESSKTPSASVLPSNWSFSKLSAERKLDIFGVILAMVGMLTLLSLLSRQRSPLIGMWVNGLYQMVGWGVYILPVALVLVGLWLVFRRVEKLPALSVERVVGLVLLYLNLITWLHLVVQGGWEMAKNGEGGGRLGGLFERLLVVGFGVPGALVLLLAWLLISLAFLLDLSIPDLVQRLVQPLLSFPGALRSARSRAQAVLPGQPAAGPVDNPGDALPPVFQPLARSAPPSRLNGSQPQRPVPAVHVAPAPAATSTPGLAPSPVTSAPPAPAEPLWTLPPLDAILDPPLPSAIQAGSDQSRARVIEETLASFGVPCHVTDILHGPTVTLFGVEPDFVENRQGNRMRVRVARIVSLQDDLALALAAPSIRIQAPVPGRNYVGIEVPNDEINRVALSEVIESESFQKLKSPLRFALGKDVSGSSAAVDLAALPHLLIAGTTGSGKSVCVNSILSSFLLHNTPQDLRLILVDPKRVELTGYNGVPHLLAPVVVDAERVVGALQWVLREMDSRYHRFSQSGVRNIQEYNRKFAPERLPYLVVIIDELADLMMLAPDETERSITRLAQLARATGIHLILATQRPSTDVVTGLIKANFPARIAFAVASNTDSRVILDQPGAEKLLGRGDMLFQAPDSPAPVRLQGVFVSDQEIQRLVENWRLSAANHVNPSAAPQSVVDDLPRGVPLHQAPLFDAPSAENSDPLLNEAIDLVRREGRASITMLQRRMRIGYTRAARLVDSMEEKGIIAEAQPNSQVREILDYGPTAPPVED